MFVIDNVQTADDFPGAPGPGLAAIVGGDQCIAMELEVYNATATIELVYRPLAQGVKSSQRSQPFNLIPQVKSYTATVLYTPCGFFAKSATPGKPATIFARVYEKSDAFTLGGNASVTQTVSGGQPIPFSEDFIRYNFQNIGPAAGSTLDILTTGVSAFSGWGWQFKDTGGGGIDLQEVGGGGFFLENIGNGLMRFSNTGTNSFILDSTGDGGIIVRDTGAGGVLIAEDGVGGVIMADNGGGGVGITESGGSAHIRLRNFGTGDVRLETSGGDIDFSAADDLTAMVGGVTTIQSNGAGDIDIQTVGTGSVNLHSAGGMTLLSVNPIIISASGGVTSATIQARVSAGNYFSVTDQTPTERFRVDSAGGILMPTIPIANPGLAGFVFRAGAGSPAALMIV